MVTPVMAREDVNAPGARRLTAQSQLCIAGTFWQARFANGARAAEAILTRSPRRIRHGPTAAIASLLRP
jgi:hypothetical protein